MTGTGGGTGADLEAVTDPAPGTEAGTGTTADTGTGPGSGPADVFRELEADDPVRLGTYPLLARLGMGGMGTVYLSRTPAGQPVAVKAIRPGLAGDPGFRRRFRQEVAAAQRVQGPYTPPVVDSDTEGTPPWLVTAFVPGPTLAAAVARHGALPVRTVLLLAAGVAEALQAVHAAGVVHRDLKPSNVLLAADGPRVIDFGVAQAADGTGLTSTGVFVGTPAFMSPEQATGARPGPATDVFSLGQVVAFAAQGAPAFGEGQAHGVLYRIVHQEPDLSGVPAALRPLLQRCLAKEPAARPSPAEIVDLCRAAADDGGPPALSGNWLPDPVTADAVRYGAVPAAHPAPERTLHRSGPGGAGARTARREDTVAAGGPAGSAPTAGGTAAGSATRVTGRRLRLPFPRRRGRGIAVAAAVCTLALAVGWGVMARTTGSSHASNSPEKHAYPGVRMPLEYSMNFNRLPLGPVRPPDTSVSTLTFTCGTMDGTCEFDVSRGDIHPLVAAQNGSLDTCRKITHTPGFVPLKDLSPGSQFCVTTAGGTVALFTFRGSGVSDRLRFRQPGKNDGIAEPGTRYAEFDIDLWYHAL